jgi:hypothetical protein
MSHSTLYEQTIENMRREVISSKEKVIHTLITKETGSAIIDIEVVKQRGMLEVFPDGSEVFRWDGAPRIVFFPIGITHHGGKAQITQQYQILLDEEVRQMAEDAIQKKMEGSDEECSKAEAGS